MAGAGPLHGQARRDSRLYKAFCLSGWFVPQPLMHHTACGIWFSDQESNLRPLHGEPRV